MLLDGRRGHKVDMQWVGGRVGGWERGEGERRGSADLLGQSKGWMDGQNHCQYIRGNECLAGRTESRFIGSIERPCHRFNGIGTLVVIGVW